jgi:hypothetical protein
LPESDRFFEVGNLARFTTFDVIFCHFYVAPNIRCFELRFCTHNYVHLGFFQIHSSPKYIVSGFFFSQKTGGMYPEFRLSTPEDVDVFSL